MINPGELPDWFVGIVICLFVALVCGFIKVLWSRYTKLEKEVEYLEKQLSKRATFDDLQKMGDGIRMDHIATQKRLDDIFTLIGSKLKSQ